MGHDVVIERSLSPHAQVHTLHSSKDSTKVRSLENKITQTKNFCRSLEQRGRVSSTYFRVLKQLQQLTDRPSGATAHSLCLQLLALAEKKRELYANWDCLRPFFEKAEQTSTDAEEESFARRPSQEDLLRASISAWLEGAGDADQQTDGEEPVVLSRRSSSLKDVPAIQEGIQAQSKRPERNSSISSFTLSEAPQEIDSTKLMRQKTSTFHNLIMLQMEGEPNMDAPNDLEISGVKVELKDFTVLKQISRGRFGRVFLVSQVSTGQMYAMKVLKLGEEDTSGIASSALGMVTTEKGILTGQASAPDFLVQLVSPLSKSHQLGIPVFTQT